MIKLSLIFFLIGFCPALNGQNYIDYYNKANEAEYLFDNGKISEAKKILKTLEKKYELKFKDYFYLGILSYLTNDTAEGHMYLKKFMNLFGNPLTYLPECKYKFPELTLPKSVISEMEFRESQIKTIFNDTSKRFLSIYKPVLDSLHFYLELDKHNWRNGNVALDPIEDYRIQQGFLNYITRSGVPPEYIFGNEFYSIVEHVRNDSLINKYKSVLFQEIVKGHIDPRCYAILVDVNLYNKYDETWFGSYSLRSTSKTSIVQVNNNRKTIGMTPYYTGLSSTFPRIFDSVEGYHFR